MAAMFISIYWPITPYAVSFVSGAYNWNLLFRSQDTLGMVEDYEIDIPQVCDYLGEVFGKWT